MRCTLQGAALAASAASPALEGNASEPPASAMLALTECISRACMPALHGPGAFWPSAQTSLLL